MEQVELRVKVIDAELTALEQKVNALKNTTISVDVNQKGTQNATKSLESYSKAAKEAEKNSSNLLTNISKFTTWYLIGGAVSGAIRSFKDAVETMKDVDDQLVVVRKVTGATTEEMERLESQAYKTASAYGVSADQYLESVAAFSRAGYGDQAAALAELSVKTQLVGDVSQETANQFLLSVDKAYQLNGEISELTKVLDGANEIDNKYATSIENIAEGLGTVAPVAAQAHISIGELSAAIGTITAVTQRSGSEAARALRALVLNILGDTKTEIDEGVTWTTGEIAGLKDVIKTYASDAYKAAQATGTLIDPMEAIGGLAQSMKDGLLTEQKLMEMVSDIGGKLRTSQLLALIQNWDMYESMLADYGDAIGSADKEVENALDSWTVKTQQLKNEWTEFISHLIDTEAVKTGLDGLIGLVNFLDGGFAKFAVTVGSATLAMSLLVKGFNAVKASAFVSTLTGMLESTEALRAGLVLLTETMLTSPLFYAAVAAAGIYLMVKAVDALTITTAELREQLADSNDELNKQKAELDTLNAKGIKNLTEAEKVRLSVLKEQTAELEKQRAELARKTLDSYKSDPSEYVPVGNRLDYAGRKKRSNEWYANQLIDKATTGIGANRGLSVLTHDERTALAEYVDELLKAKEAGAELTDEEENLIRKYTVAEQRTLSAAKALDEAAESEKETARQADLLKARVSAVSSAVKEFNDYSDVTEKTLEDLESSFPGLTSVILDNKGALTEEAKAALTATNSFLDLIAKETILNNSTFDFSQKIAELQKLAIQAGLTASMVASIGGSSSALDDEVMDAIQNGMTPDEARDYVTGNYWARLLSHADETETGEKEKPTVVGGGGKKSSDPELERRKSIISLLKSELSLYKERGDAESLQIAKMREIQNALHDEAEYLRSIGASQEDINALSEEWWKYQNQISKLLGDSLSNTLKEMQKSEEDAIQSQIDALEEKNKKEEDAVTLAEKELAVQEALAALENARNERTVRQYNASSGQWEWVADANNVKSAEKDYEKAVEDLADFRKTMEKQALQAELKAVGERYDALNTALDALIEAVASGAISISEALSGASALGISSLVSGEKGAASVTDKMKANSAAWFSADEAGKQALADENALLGASMGWTRKADGAWYTADGTRAYDTGGILTGMGGIKATRGSEMVLPPDITGMMLSPKMTAAAQERFDELRWLYGGGGTKPSGIGGTSIGNQQNGNFYSLNGITISEQKAKTTSVYDLAQMSRSLSVKNQV